MTTSKSATRLVNGLVMISTAMTFTLAGAIASAAPSNGKTAAHKNKSAHVQTVADLRSTLPIASSSVIADGYDKFGDGGGGRFYWDASATRHDNGVTVIGNDAAPGRWVRKIEGPLSVVACGATSAPTVDNSAPITKCLSQVSDILIPDGDFYVSDAGINIPSNRNITFSKKARILLLPSAKGGYQILGVKDAHDVNIYNPTIVGDKYTHLAGSGEWGMGISVLGGTNISIINPNISKCWGDGIYIGHGATFSNGVLIQSARLADNRRQGISIISGKNVRVLDAMISGTGSDNPGGTPLKGGPHAGIDIEPDDSTNEVGVLIRNLKTANNQGYGLLVSLERLTDGLKGEKSVSVEVSGHNDYGSKGGIMFGGWPAKNGAIAGSIVVSGQQYLNSRGAGIAVRGYPNTMPLIKMNAPHIKNWAAASEGPIELSAAISIFDAGGDWDIGNVLISSPIIERTDDPSAWGDRALYANNRKIGRYVKNVTITKPKIMGVKTPSIFNGSGEVEGIGF